MADLARADDIAVGLCQAYQSVGLAGFVIRTTDTGDVRLIGLQLPPEVVSKMLRIAADAYERDVAAVVRN